MVPAKEANSTAAVDSKAPACPATLADWPKPAVAFVITGQQLGYIGYHQSRDLAAEIDAGRKVSCEIVRITGGGGWLCFRRRYGVNVRLVIA